jgi:hypothetical protein
MEAATDASAKPEGGCTWNQSLARCFLACCEANAKANPFRWSCNYSFHFDWLPTLDAFRTFAAVYASGMLPGFLSAVSRQIGAAL